jgi:hypothetical protein
VTRVTVSDRQAPSESAPYGTEMARHQGPVTDGEEGDQRISEKCWRRPPSCGDLPFGVWPRWGLGGRVARGRLLQLLHGLLQGLIEVLGVNAQVFRGLLLGPGHGLLDGVFDLAFPNHDQAGLAGVDELPEFFDLRP